jgi:disease resistance protein RPM1
LARKKRSGLVILEQEAVAMIAVQVVLEKLASFVAEETRFLGGVRGGIVELQDDLYSMKSFLQDAEERSESDQGLRDVAYDAEDILEEFMLRFAPSHGSGFIHCLRNSYRSISKLIDMPSTSTWLGHVWPKY